METSVRSVWKKLTSHRISLLFWNQHNSNLNNEAIRPLFNLYARAWGSNHGTILVLRTLFLRKCLSNQSDQCVLKFIYVKTTLGPIKAFKHEETIKASNGIIIFLLKNFLMHYYDESLPTQRSFSKCSSRNPLWMYHAILTRNTSKCVLLQLLHDHQRQSRIF